MELRALLPREFPGRDGEAEGEGEARGGREGVRRATRIAVREFFPVVLVLVAVDVSTDGVLLGTLTVLPNYVQPGLGEAYVFAFLGAGAYAMTSLAFNPKESIVETYRLTYRMVGALPVGAAVFLFGGRLTAVGVTAPVNVLAFVSGLYIRLTLRRVGDLAERLYGTEDDTANQPFETERHRRATQANLRQSWRTLATREGQSGERGEAVALLERAEAITDDAAATHQELVRAHDLSERALARLGAGESESDGGPDAGRPAGDGRSGDDRTGAEGTGRDPGDRRETEEEKGKRKGKKGSATDTDETEPSRT
ncbi:MAG: hypothetical protein V5A28_03125 [Haloarculaceae archaeon]